MRESYTPTNKKSAQTMLSKMIIVGGVIVLIFTFFVLQVIPEHTNHGQKLPTPFISYFNINTDTQEQSLHEFMLLFDTEPLILPTQWNYASRFNDSTFEEESPIFASFPPSIKINDSLLKPPDRTYQEEILTPIHFLKRKPNPWNFFSTFGQKASKNTLQDQCSGYMKVIDINSGKLIKQEKILQIKGIDEPASLWEPVIFSIMVETHGPVGSPLLLNSSGINKIDKILREYLADYLSNIHLTPGYYKIQVAP
jgi:hypothetical protein